MEKIAPEIMQQEAPITEVTGAQNESAEEKESFLKSLRFMTGRKYSNAPFWKILSRPSVEFFFPAVILASLIYEESWDHQARNTTCLKVSCAAPYRGKILGPRSICSLSDLLDRTCAYFRSREYGYGVRDWLYFLLGHQFLRGLRRRSFSEAFKVPPIHSARAYISVPWLQNISWTYFDNDWLAKDGVLDVSNVLWSTLVAIVMLTSPLWVDGKRIRSTVARNGLNRFMED
ncbi:hypothetical protein BKA64DRAFT_635299 [Cadophora sp. MPI-SDFR-AT-0126]|nr:hypothetical protein BKA64DRAFT_635299 [Leotiomycetes sp. MPI-SDFR-AT-0126]